MEAATQPQELVVWTQPQMLDEAKLLFAPFAPKFQTMPCSARTALERFEVGVLYLSHSDQDHSVERTLAALRNCKISTLVLYVPHHSTEFAFKVGTMVGRQNFADAEWAFNLPHLKQLLKARNITSHGVKRGHEEASFAVDEARERLGLNQVEMANALNVTARTLQNWEAGKGTSQMYKKTRDLRELLSRMDDYVVAPKEKQWLSSPLGAFAGKTPQELIAAGRTRDLVVEFQRLHEGQPV